MESDIDIKISDHKRKRIKWRFLIWKSLIKRGYYLLV